MIYFVLFFFFKQKTAYEMRISDWSSDVCSSDLNQGSVDGQTTQGVSAGPLELPVFFTAEPQDNDDSESITKVTLALEGAPEGAAFVSGGEAIEEGAVIAGGTARFVDGKQVLTFEPGVADRKRVVEGKSVSVRVALGGRRILQTKKQ